MGQRVEVPWVSNPLGTMNLPDTAFLHHVAVTDLPGTVDVPPIAWATKLHRPPDSLDPR